MKKIISFTTQCLLISILSSISCSPKIYVIDQPTIMEMESAGEWPEFENQTENNTTQFGPTPFPKEKISKQKQNKMKTLMGESFRPAQSINPASTTNK